MESILHHFSEAGILCHMCECLQQEKPLSAPLRERLAGLLAAGAVESIGRGKGTRYILSDKIATWHDVDAIKPASDAQDAAWFAKEA